MSEFITVGIPIFIGVPDNAPCRAELSFGDALLYDDRPKTVTATSPATVALRHHDNKRGWGVPGILSTLS